MPHRIHHSFHKPFKGQTKFPSGHKGDKTGETNERDDIYSCALPVSQAHVILNITILMKQTSSCPSCPTHAVLSALARGALARLSFWHQVSRV